MIHINNICLQDSGGEHMDFDNPLYREMSGLDLPQNPNDIIFLPDSNTVRFLIKLEKFRGYYNNYQMLLQ